MWRPGESGNPKGRPKGSRNKLSERVLHDIAQHWSRNGKTAIQEVFKSDKGLYLRTVASLLPHEVRLTAAVATGDVRSWVEVVNLSDRLEYQVERDPLLPPLPALQGELVDPEV